MHLVMPAGVGPCKEEGRPGDVPAHDAHLQRGGPHQGGSPCLQRHAQVNLLEQLGPAFAPFPQLSIKSPCHLTLMCFA